MTDNSEQTHKATDEVDTHRMWGSNTNVSLYLDVWLQAALHVSAADLDCVLSPYVVVLIPTVRSFSRHLTAGSPPRRTVATEHG
jgi:hypothetical protein